MVHTVPNDHTVDGNSASSCFGGDVEKFSGLRISERQLRPARWDDLMRGKRYVAFDRLSSISTLVDGSKDAVMIGVLYEKSLRKTGSSGNEYVQWNFTNLAYPQPQVMTVFLHGQAYDAWESSVEVAVATGSIFAMLNPVPLPQKDSMRPAAKVTYGTQLVRLGTCPSLGHCSCRKKDGLPCSMPCDKDRGPLVCYWHAQSQAAQNANKWKRQGSASNSSAGTAPHSHTDGFFGGRSATDGIFVVQAPSRQTMGPPLNQAPGSRPPAAAQTRTPHANNSRSNAKPAGIDAATQRLLGSQSATNLTKDGGASAAPARTSREAAHERAGGRMPASPARVGAAGLGVPSGPSADRVPSAAAVRADLPNKPTADRPDKPRPEKPAVVAKAANDAASREGALVQSIMARHPRGIPEPDPNNPLANLPDSSVTSTFNARTRNDSVAPAKSLSAAVKLLASKSQPHLQRRARDQPQSKIPTTQSSASSSAPVLLSSEGTALQSKNGDSGKAAPKTSEPTPAARRRRAEAEFGSKIAAQLNVADPSKDIVRQQGSRFGAVIEAERVAKRHRDLAELEMQDAMAEKMEALVSISVQAFRCPQCSLTTESFKAKAVCEQEGHAVTTVTVQKTHWECRNCSLTVFVLDRELPSECGRCSAYSWKQIALRRVAKVPMDRELLLPRGEELPFLNSIPGFKRWEPVKEGKDDYEGL